MVRKSSRKFSGFRWSKMESFRQSETTEAGPLSHLGSFNAGIFNSHSLTFSCYLLLIFYNKFHTHIFITVRKRSCGKVMYSQTCVKNSVHRGVCLSACWDTPNPSPGQAPHQADTPPLLPPNSSRRLLQRTVLILLDNNK